MGAALPTAAPAVYGVLQLGAAQVALPLEALREVIPCPAGFAPLPSAARGLIGAVDVRGQVVPVLDLCAVLGWADAGAAERVIVLVRQRCEPATAGAPPEHRLIGLVTHGVRGLTAPPALHGVGTVGGDAPLLFSASFIRPDHGAVVSVLDPAALLRLPGVPSLRLVARAAGGPAVARPANERPMMLVRCGAYRLAIDVADVQTTLPHVVVKPSSVGGGTCRGVVEHDGAELPAVDPLGLLALGTLPAEDRCQGLLLRFPEGSVVVLVSEVVDIAAVSDDALLRLPAMALQRSDLFAALAPLPGRGDHLVLRRGALHDEPALRALAGLNVRRSGRAASSAMRAMPAASVIVFDAGRTLAARLTEVQEIVVWPGSFMPAVHANDAVVGLFTHQRRAVTLVCLGRLLGLPAVQRGPEARVLLARHDGTWVGFIVSRLYSIETPRWQQPGSAPVARFAGHPLIELGEGTLRQTVPLLDMPDLARRLDGATPETPETPPAADGAAPAEAAPAGAAPADAEPLAEPALAN